ncbi:MAG: hypothetical protein JNM69_31565 [Archangium sp.]|nr:hypothetical protein [Archangium sp.]
MRFETPQPGLFVVHYQSAAELAPALQGPLVEALERRLAEGPVAVVFEVGPAISMVELSVPSFWLDLTSRLAITAMTIVTTSSAVRIAARGFKLAQSVRKHPIAVETHEALGDGIAWARGQLP